MRRSRLVVIVAAAAAFVGWGGLILQFLLLVPQMGLLDGIWRFFGFFTILTNLGAALVATSMAFGGRSVLAEPRARLMAATSILMVGLVYSIALRELWNPTGLQAIADKALHDVTPLAWLVLWLVAPHPRLAWKEIWWALVPPFAYVVYALARGAVDGWYAYWFLDPSQQAPGELLTSVIVLLLAFVCAAALLVAADRWLARRAHSQEADLP